MAPQTLGWIWPKDPRPGNPSHWPRRWRLSDVFSNRGPDIYVGKIHHSNTKKKTQTQPQPQNQNLNTGKKHNPSTAEWSRWHRDADIDDTPIPWARGRGGQRYDFRRRKYTVPDQGTWSQVEYCSGRKVAGRWRKRFGGYERHCVPRRYWDRNGEEYPANHWHDIIYGAHDD